jgi:signal transduction histidine kinase
MNDAAKTTQQLQTELAETKQRIEALQAAAHDRRRIEQAIKEDIAQIARAKQEWEMTADSLPQLICLLDNQKRVVRANRVVEEWGLTEVVKTKGQTVYELLYPGRAEAESYLKTFLEQAWDELLQERSAECEVKDEILNRHLHVQIHPLSRHTSRQSKATDSMAALILHDITERKELERLRNEFLTNISQELETPLTAIIGYSQILLTGIEGELPEDLRAEVQEIHEHGQQLRTLIDEVLDLAEIESGSLILVPERVVLEPLLHKIKDDYTAIFLNNPIKIALKIEPALPPIAADPMRLEQLLNHLVMNGVKAAQQRQVNLSAFRDNDWVCFEVKTTSSGRDEVKADLNLKQLHHRDTRVAGAGLGLTIARHLVQLHRGVMAIQSQPRQGISVTVRLPIEQER